MSDQKWGVIGGGILGMTLAYRLAQRGCDVTLIEAADHLGGLADGWELGDIRWDRHYHVTLLSDSYTRAILRELDLDDSIDWVETKTGFYTDGQLYSMSNTLEFLRFPPLRLIDKLRLGATIFYTSKIRNWKRLEGIPVADWLGRWSGKRTLEKIWLPLLRAKLGDNYRHASAAFIWATIARMYAARRTGLKKEMFGYVQGGYPTTLRHFEQRIRDEGVDVSLSTRCQHVRQVGEGSVRVTYEDESYDQFDQVVLTVPSGVASRLCPDFTEHEHALLSGIRYQGIVCASMLLEKGLSNYYVTNITDPGIPFTGIIEMTALVPTAQFGGKHLVYLPKYVPADDDATFAMTDLEIQERSFAALETMYPHFRREHVSAFRVSRERNVMAVPTIDYSQRVPTRSTSLSNVSVVNSSQIVNGTLNVNETIRLAEEAADGLLSRSASAAVAH